MRLLLVTYLSLVFLGVLNAQDVKFQASVSKTKVVIGEQFQISFTVNAMGSRFKSPPLNDFVVYMGPSTSTNMQFINGNVSQQVSYSYIVAASKEGVFQIAPASITVDGKVYISNSIKVEVVKNNPAPNQNIAKDSKGGGNNERIFVSTALSKNKCYIGEEVTVYHKIYSIDRIVGFRDIDFPTYDGCWSQILDEKNQNVTLDIENVDGVNYYVAVLRKTVIFPQHAGKLKVMPVSIDLVVRQKTKENQDDFWGSFFGTSYKDVAYKANGIPTTLEVMSFPDKDKPASFSGTVGEFTYAAKLNKQSVKANEAINLSITISGNGNLKLIDIPKVEIPEGMETYEPKVNENITMNESGMKGAKTFEWVLIPRYGGDFTISVPDFSFFSTQKKNYVTLNAPEFSIQVSGDSMQNPIVNYRSSDKQDLQELAKDIRYIKQDTKLSKKDVPFFGSWKFYTSFLTPLIAFMGLMFYRRRLLKNGIDINALKSRMAVKVAIKQLANANLHYKNNEVDKFFEAIIQAMNGYASNKLKINLADLSKDSLVAKMNSLKISESLIKEWFQVYEHCEMMRYAPAGSAIEMENIYEKTKKLLTAIEEHVG